MRARWPRGSPSTRGRGGGSACCARGQRQGDGRPTACSPTTSAPGSSCRRPASGCSTTITWSWPRSDRLARTCRGAYYDSCRPSPPPSHSGEVRVYAMAVELVRHTDSRLDRQQLVAFLNSYQTVAPLTIGELWAWPSMLRLALLENLRRLADEIRSPARRTRRPPTATSRGWRRAPPTRRPTGRRRRSVLTSCNCCTASATTARCSRRFRRHRRRAGGARHQQRRRRARGAPAAGDGAGARSPTSSPACGCAPRSTGG